MTARGTALLVLLLALLAGYLWMAEVRPRLARGTLATRPETPALLTVPAGRIARVELEEGGRRLAALRRDEVWVDEQGRPWRGDAVTSLVDTLGSLGPVMVVDSDPERRADYGLAEGASILRCVGDDGRAVLSLELGASNPAGTGVYAHVAGQREVLLVGGLLRWEVEKLRRAVPAAAD